MQNCIARAVRRGKGMAADPGGPKPKGFPYATLSRLALCLKSHTSPHMGDEQLRRPCPNGAHVHG